MKSILILVFLLVSSVISHAQIYGPAIFFTYTHGFRTKREYKLNEALLRQGTNPQGLSADTTVIAFKGLENSPSGIFIKAYPNPATEVLFVENLHWKEEDVASVVLSDISGRKIQEKTVKQPNAVLDVRNCLPGNYILTYLINNVFITSWKISKL